MSTAPSASSRPGTGAAAALSYVLFFVASLVLPGALGQNGGASLVTPYSTDAEVARYLAETSRGLVPVAAFCQAMSALSLLLFVPYAARYLRRVTPGSVAADVARASGIVAAALLLISAAAQWVLQQPGIGGSLPVYRAVMDVTFITGAAAQVAPTGLLIAAIAGPARRTGALPGWLAWLGLIAAALSALSMLSLLGEWATPFIPLGRFLGMAWFLGLSAVLPRRLSVAAPVLEAV